MFVINSLKKRPVWVCWKMEPSKDGKPTKIPKNPHTGYNAQSNNPDTWSSYDDACVAVNQYGFDGVGFMFDADICGIDLDGQNPTNERAARILELMDTYGGWKISGWKFFRQRLGGTRRISHNQTPKWALFYFKEKVVI